MSKLIKREFLKGIVILKNDGEYTFKFFKPFIVNCASQGIPLKH